MRAVSADSRARAVERKCAGTLAAMGLSIPDPLVALDEARAIFDRSQDLTLAIEEEFQIVDPETHGLVNRFAELKARTDATPLGEHTAGELISSEIEIKTGRCESFPEAARALIERRRALLDEADAIGVGARGLRHAPVVAVVGAGGHRHAPLPHRRGHAALRRLAQQHVRDPHPHRGAAAPTARWRSTTRCARCSPTCSRSRRPRPGTRAATRTCTRRAASSSRACSRAAASPSRSTAGPTTTASCAGSSRPTRSRSTPRSGGACGRTSRTARSSCATPTRSPTCASRSRSWPTPTRSRRGACGRSTRASRSPSCAAATSRRTCGARSAGASRAS